MNKMTLASLTLQDHCVSVRGVLSFATVAALRNAGEKILAKKDILEFNFTDVSRSDSAGLALLIAWSRSAKKNKKTITFTHLPKQLFDIARISGLDKILPIL